MIAQLAPAPPAATRRRHGLVTSYDQSQRRLTDHQQTHPRWFIQPDCFPASLDRFCVTHAVLYLGLAGSAKAATAAELTTAEAAACTEDEPMDFLLQFALWPLHGHQRTFILQSPLRLVDFRQPHLRLSDLLARWFFGRTETEVHCSRVILERFSWHLSSEPQQIDGGGDVKFTVVHSLLSANSSPVHRGHFLPTVCMIFCHFEDWKHWASDNYQPPHCFSSAQSCDWPHPRSLSRRLLLG